MNCFSVCCVIAQCVCGWKMAGFDADLETDCAISNDFNYFNGPLWDKNGYFPTEANEQRESLKNAPSTISVCTADQTPVDHKQVKVETTSSVCISGSDSAGNVNESESVKTRPRTEQFSKPGGAKEETGRHETTKTSSIGDTSGDESESTGLEPRLSDLDVNDVKGKHAQTPITYPSDIACGETGESYDHEIYAKDEDGDTLLHLSIILATNHSLYLINLTKEKVCLNTFNKLLQTPLHLALLTKQVAVIRALVKAGALVDLRDERGRTPFHVACEIDKVEFVEILLTSPHMRPWTFCSPNAILGQTDAMTLDIKNYTGETCLHVATKRANRGMVTLLLSNGADVNFPDGKSNRTALHFASEVGDVEMVDFLILQNNITIDCKTLNGETPIILAFIRDHREVVNSLKNQTKLNLKEVKKYADINSDDHRTK